MSRRHPSNRHLTPELILNAYHQGFFPMASEAGDIGFYAYEPRGILPLDDRFTVRRSLRQIIRRQQYEIRMDTSPREVLQACSRAEKLPANEIWLSEELIELYVQTFDLGALHTVEVWKPGAEGERDELVGGLYGLVFGAAFCGESMFSRVPFASQIALVHLVEHLRTHKFVMLDAQMTSDHLKQFGLIECSQKEYMAMFRKASELDATF